MKKFQKKTTQLKHETYAFYLAYKDPRLIWWKKLFIMFIIGYLFSPIDLIPDFIPIMGYIDDLVIVPLGLSLAIKLIPKEIMDECRLRAQKEQRKEIPVGKKTALVIILIWIVGLVLMIYWVINIFSIFFSVS